MYHQQDKNFALMRQQELNIQSKYTIRSQRHQYPQKATTNYILRNTTYFQCMAIDHQSLNITLEINAWVSNVLRHHTIARTNAGISMDSHLVQYN